MIFWRSLYRVLRRTFYYSGRTGRDEFWWWMRVLFRAVLVWFVAMVVIMLMVRSGPVRITLVSVLVDLGALVGLVGFLPTLSLTVRRLHDTGRSGGVVLAWLVLPLVAWIVSLGIGFVTLGLALAGLDPSVAVIAFYASLGVAVVVTLAMACWAIWWLQQDGNDGPNPFGDVPRQVS